MSDIISFMILSGIFLGIIAGFKDLSKNKFKYKYKNQSKINILQKFVNYITSINIQQPETYTYSTYTKNTNHKRKDETKIKRNIILKIIKLDPNKKIEDLINYDIDRLKTILTNLQILKEYESTTNEKKETIIEPEIKEEEKIKKIQYNKRKRSYYEKGIEYEKFVAKHFEKLGYIIKFNGIEKKKKDNSIDLIAIKKDEIILVQCKNWSEKNKYRITHKDIKAFIGDTHFFIEENPQYKDYNIKRLFVISEKILDKSAYSYIKEHQNKIKYLLLPFNKSHS